MTQTNSTYSTRLELLTRDNYDTWKIQAEALCIKHDTWGYISGEIKEPTVSTDVTTRAAQTEALKAWSDADRKARSDLILAIHPSELSHIRGCQKSREVWTRLETVYASKGPARKATLLKRLTQTKMHDGEDANAHLTGFFDAVDKLKAMEVDIHGDLLTIMLLYSLPDTFENFRCAIESRDALPDAETLKIKILEEFSARQHKLDINQNAAMYANQGRSNTKNSRAPENENKNAQSKAKSKLKCGFCKKKGHKEADCFFKKAANKQKTEDQTANKVDHEVISWIADVQHTSAPKTSDLWCVDSGCTAHLCNDLKLFSNTQETDSNLRLANNATSKVTSKGVVKINIADTDKSITLSNALYVPDLANNLLSVARIVDTESTVTFSKHNATVRDKGGELKFIAPRIGDLFFLREEAPRSCLVLEKDSTVKRWHQRLGHLNFAEMRHMLHSQAVKGLEMSGAIDRVKCDTCIAGKLTAAPFKSSETTTKEPLELIHSDLCGPMRVSSVEGASYFLTFIDDYSRLGYVFFIRNKSDVVDTFVQFKNLVENQTGYKIKNFQSDNGREFYNQRMIDFLKQAGIHHRLTVPYTPQQNGVAERRNRTLVEAARCMMLESGLPPSLWAEAIGTANHVRNRCTSRSIPSGTPYERWIKNKPDVTHLRAFGEKVFILNKAQNKGKFDARGIPGYFVGYSANSKAYRVWIPGERTIRVSRDIQFLNEFQKQGTPAEVFPDKFLSPGEVTIHQDGPTHRGETDAEEQTDEEKSKVNRPSGSVETRVRTPGRPKIIRTGLRGRPRKMYLTAPREENCGTPEGCQSEKETPGHSGGEDDSPGADEPEVTDYAMNAVEIPLQEAVNGPNRGEWMEAMYSEVKSLVDNDTWDLVDRPANAKVIGCRTVLRNKHNPDGTICRRKARVVAQGFSQRPGMEFTETFAPVARLDSFRMLMALSVKMDMKIDQIDITTAYLNGDIDKEIYMTQPKYLAEFLTEMISREHDEALVRKAKSMFSQLQSGDKVCRLRKALYGLRQAGRQWHATLDKTLKSIGLFPSESDPCMYIDRESKDPTYLLVYVDDMLIASRNATRITEIKQKLSSAFTVKDIGQARYCLGLEIERSQHGISICQRGYIQEVLQKFGMSESKVVRTPISTGVDLRVPDDVEQGSGDLPYRQLIGALMYIAVGTRPDISYAVNMLSQFNVHHDNTHWTAAKRVLRYLKGTIDIKLWYEKDAKGVTGYADADWGNCKIDRRSYSGYVFVLSGAAISWCSRKQRTVALSSTEAEYMCVTEAAKEAICIFNLLKELKRKESSEIIIYNDNQSAEKLAKNPVYHARSKHIDIRYHFIRQAIKEYPLRIEYLPTEEMTADILTKPLGANKHEFCTVKLGLSV